MSRDLRITFRFQLANQRIDASQCFLFTLDGADRFADAQSFSELQAKERFFQTVSLFLQFFSRHSVKLF
jgi:hypothetical protein